MRNPIPALQYPKSKLLILALLCINALMYAALDSLNRGIDAVTWLILLVTYELETNSATFSVSAGTLDKIRTILIAIIIGVFFSYLNESRWLDVCNSLLWFALIAIMEVEVRRPDIVFKYATLCWVLTVSIFIGLISMAALWLHDRAWLDAYDALLWITAFGLIEVDIFHFLKRKQPQY